MHSLLILLCLASLNVTVTFSSLYEDINPLLSENDTLFYIAPPGIDPHTYQLTPKDVERLKSSDLIISTAHAPFELKIKEMVEKGEIKAKLVEIPYIKGIKLKKNPVLNQTILHMPIYDPENYKVFILYIADILSELNPQCEREYKNNSYCIIKKLENITSKSQKLNLTGVGDFPFIPYAVSWLNITVSYLVVKEWGVPPSPNDLLVIEEKMKNGKINIAVVTKSKSAASQKLEYLANKYGVPVLHVYSPVVKKSILEKLEYIKNQCKNLKKEVKTSNFELVFLFLSFLIALVIRVRKKNDLS